MRAWGNASDSEVNPIDRSEWETHFQSLFNENSQLPDEKFRELDKLENATYFSQVDFKIIPEDILRAAKRLNKEASAGPDKYVASYYAQA